MRFKTLSMLCFVVSVSVIAGCGKKEVASGPVQGTLQLENLTPEQQIEKVQNDKSIPDQYKQTYINSIRSKAAGGSGKP